VKQTKVYYADVSKCNFKLKAYADTSDNVLHFAKKILKNFKTIFLTVLFFIIRQLHR